MNIKMRITATIEGGDGSRVATGTITCNRMQLPETFEAANEQTENVKKALQSFFRNWFGIPEEPSKPFQPGPQSFTISLVIPTVGRPSLKRTLESLVDQPWQPGDEILLIGDVESGEEKSLAIRSVWAGFKGRIPCRYLEVPPGTAPHGDWGHSPRMLAMPRATATHLAALDDDDIWLPDALKLIRVAITKDPHTPHLFRMRHNDGKIHPGYGTPTFITPNVPEKLGRYTSTYGGDGHFIAATDSDGRRDRCRDCCPPADSGRPPGIPR